MPAFSGSCLQVTVKHDGIIVQDSRSLPSRTGGNGFLTVFYENTWYTKPPGISGEETGMSVPAGIRSGCPDINQYIYHRYPLIPIQQE
jgi:hypothetical protein